MMGRHPRKLPVLTFAPAGAGMAGMKTLLFAIALFSLSLCHCPAVEPEFIIVTVLTTWNDGLESQAGEIERVWSKNEKGYLVKAEGRDYLIPLQNAHVISAAEAAVALIALREQTDRQLAALEDKITALQGKTAKAAPTQRNGRPLPPNWIDPDEADRRFQAQQLQQQMQNLQNQIRDQKR